MQRLAPSIGLVDRSLTESSFLAHRYAPVSGFVRTDGKHLELGGEPFRIKGVTYGSFAPRSDGELFPETPQLRQDLLEMSISGINVVRTYTLPPVDFLENAAELGIRVIAGLHYEDWRYEASPGRAAHRKVADGARAEVERALERCSGRPEVLALSVGNEVPADVVRTHGIHRVEATLSGLIEQIHEGDPNLLATYCNFPTTEFLQVESQDLICFNVFLEDPNAFRRYLRHLHVLAGDLPLVVTELGLASNLHGEDAQAAALEWQLKIVDECGIAGATVFAWTDEWAVAGAAVDGWEFGLTDADRMPKAGLDVVERWTRSSLRDLRESWPRISVVVCAYNAESLIEKCLSSLEALAYPNLEVIVCDDGSSDGTLAIAQRFPFKVLELDRGGLSRARNAGIEASTGEIVAFLDSDAFCHSDWPYYIALSMEEESVVATGGPNLPVRDVGVVEHAVAVSPGAPVEVLIGGDRAEHVPGCNMAFDKNAIQDVGCFNPVYTAAGDDVDVCWKLLDQGGEIGFAPAAQVRHHRRDTVRGYLKQQRGYGRAEALLMPGHRHRFNRLGQARWAGFVYGGPRLLPRFLRPVVYHGYAGAAPFQSIDRHKSSAVRDWGVALMPLIVGAGLTALPLALLSLWWLAVTAVCLLGVGVFAALIGAGATIPSGVQSEGKFRGLVAFMHVAQPLVRTWTRVRTRPTKRESRSWTWHGDRVQWVRDLERELCDRRFRVRLGGVNTDWDLEVWRWSLTSWRVTTAVLWGWTPVTRLRPAVRSAGLGALALSGATFVFAPPAGLIVAALTILGGVVEAVLVRRTLDKAIHATASDALDA